MNALHKAAYWVYSTIDQIHAWKGYAEKWNELADLGPDATLEQLNDILPYDVRKAIRRIISEAESQAASQ